MIKTRRRVLTTIVILSLFIAMGTCVCGKDRTYHGRVIDADSKEPIEGAVVVAEWKTERSTPTATHTNLKDVKEVLTDKNGDWSITGPKGRADELIPGLSLVIPYTKEPIFTIFYPGYCPWPLGFYIDACKDKLKPGGNGKIIEGETIELQKLTNREDRLRAVGVAPESMSDILVHKQKPRKLKNFFRLLNEENRLLGLSEYPIGKELENER